MIYLEKSLITSSWVAICDGVILKPFRILTSAPTVRMSYLGCIKCAGKSNCFTGPRNKALVGKNVR